MSLFSRFSLEMYVACVTAGAVHSEPPPVQPNKSAPRTAPHPLPINPLNQKHHMCPTPPYPCYHWSQKVGPPSENSIQAISVAQCCFERKLSIFFLMHNFFMAILLVWFALKFCHMHWPLCTPWYLAFPRAHYLPQLERHFWGNYSF